MAVDKELIKGINLMLEGKEEGFNVLYSKTYNYVYGRAKMIMKEEEDALDLTQETFIQAYKNIHTLEDVNNIYAWLGGIVYRHGMKIFRKKRDLLVNEDAEGIFDDIVSEDKDFRPEENAEMKATSNVIMSMIEELPELQKAAILAFYYDNMKIDDIAEAFECSSNTIKSRLNYAKKYLKDKVEAHEKAYAYKLHSLSPAVIILAFKSLLASEQYTMSAAVAQGVYNGACTAVGFAPMAIATADAVMSGSVSAATGSATTATATTTATTTVGAGVAKAGMAIGTKIALGLAVVATVGTLGLGGAYIANNGGFEGLLETIGIVEDDDTIDSQEKEKTVVWREGDIVSSVDEYYALMAQYANEGVTDFEIYVKLDEGMGSQAFLKSARLQNEYDVKAGIYGEYIYESEPDENGGYSAKQEEIDGVTYQIWAGTLEYGDTIYIASNPEEYKACVKEAISKKQEKFTVYIYYADSSISEETIEAYHQDGRIGELQEQLSSDLPEGNALLVECNVDGTVSTRHHIIGAQYPLWTYQVIDFQIDVESIQDAEQETEQETGIVKGWNLQAGEYYGRGGKNYTITIVNSYTDANDLAKNTFDITVVNKLGTHQIETLEVQNIGFTNVDGQDVLHFGGTVIDALDGEENEWDIYIYKSGTNDLIVHHFMTRGSETVELGVMGPQVMIHEDNAIIDRRADVDQAAFTGTDTNGNAVAVDITEFSVNQYDEAEYIPVITFVDPRTNNTVTFECTTLSGYHGQYAFDIYGICSFYCYTDTSCIYESDNVQEEYRGWGYFYYDKNGNICLTYTNENGDLVLSDVTCYRN